jgi:hypothetical protein
MGFHAVMHPRAAYSLTAGSSALSLVISLVPEICHVSRLLMMV